MGMTRHRMNRTAGPPSRRGADRDGDEPSSRGQQGTDHDLSEELLARGMRYDDGSGGAAIVGGEAGGAATGGPLGALGEVGLGAAPEPQREGTLHLPSNWLQSDSPARNPPATATANGHGLKPGGPPARANGPH
jgi:hypothetical protein